LFLIVIIEISCAGSLEFKYRTCPILHSVSICHHRFNIYASSCDALALWRGVGHRKLRCTT